MIGFFWNGLLATCWVFLTGSFEALNYAFGFVVGYLVIALIHRHVPSLKGYPLKLPRVIGLLFFLARELVVSNIKVALDIVTPPLYMKPGVIGYKLSAETDLEITFIANMISLTPGTLCLDVSEDRTTMFVHAMFLNDEEEVRRDLEKLEHRLLLVMR
jgi:multicomponent Na+:H+ antiporter subunit E